MQRDLNFLPYENCIFCPAFSSMIIYFGGTDRHSLKEVINLGADCRIILLHKYNRPENKIGSRVKQMWV